jgi:hypothetical protein
LTGASPVTAKHQCSPGHSGAMRKHRTRNLEIPGLVLTHHPGMTESSSDLGQASSIISENQKRIGGAAGLIDQRLAGDGEAPMQPRSFRGDAKHRTRNPRIPRCATAHLRNPRIPRCATAHLRFALTHHPGTTESFNAIGAGWLRSRGQGDRENFKFAVPGWPATRPRMNNGRSRIPLFRSRAAPRVE